MACLSNTPSFTYVSVQNMVIGYRNIYYNIKNMYSSDKYFYWDKNESPFELITSNTTLESKEGLFLIVVNNKGTFILPNQTEITINFDNTSGTDSSSNLLNMVEKISDIEKKYTNITQTVDGITKVVGILRDDLKGSADIYAKIQQTAKQIELLVQEVNKGYSDTNIENDLRQKIISYTIKMNTMFSDFITTMRNVFADSFVSGEENYQLINEMNKLDTEMKEYFNYIDELIDVMSQKKETENANLLKSQKEALEGAFNNFQMTLWDSTEDRAVTPSETSILIGFATTCQARLDDLKKTCDDFLFIGIGGAIYEEIAKLNVEKNRIIMSLNAITTTMKSSLSLEKSELQAQYDDILAQLNLLENWIKEASEDGTITVIERNILKERMTNLENESNDLVEKYEEYLETLSLDEDEFSEMRSQFLEYSNNYNSLVENINQVTKDNYFNEAEKAQVITALEEYRVAVNNFFKYLGSKLAKSEDNRYSEEIENAKGEVALQIQNVSDALDNLDVNIDETFKNNIIDKVERAAIETNLSSLSFQKEEVDSQYNRIILKASMSDTTLAERKNLDEKYNAFVNAYTSIVNEVTRILNKKDLVSDEDKASMDSLYNVVREAISNYTTAANGALIYISENEAKVINTTLAKDIENLKTRVDNIEVGYDDTFANNVIDKAERKEIKSKRNILDVQNADIKAQYNTLSSSTYITPEDKTNLTNSYNAYTNKYAILNKAIDDALNKTTLLDDPDVEKIDNAMKEFSNSLSDFIAVANKVIENIANEQTKKYTSSFNTRITKLEDSLNNIDTMIDATLSDSIVSKAERKTLKAALKALETSKLNVDNQYKELYKNKKLSASVKSKYKKAYNNYITSYNAYVKSINNIINTSGTIDNSLKEIYERAYETYKTNLDAFSKQHQLAVDDVTNNISSEMKADMTKETREVMEALKTLDSSMEDIFNDSRLTDAEKATIRSYLNAFKAKKETIDTKYNSILNDLTTQTSRTRLTNAYNDYNTAYNSLYNAVDTLLNRTDMLSDDDRNILDGYISAHNSALEKYSLVYKDMVDESTRNFVEKTKEELENSLNSINKTISDLQTNLDGVFRDGILTEAEKNSIKQALQILQNEKTKMKADYLSIYSNNDLVDKNSNDQPKTDLKNAYDSYESAHTNLVNVINEMLNKDGIIDSNDKQKLDDAFADYRSRLQSLKIYINFAIDAISGKKVDDERSERIEQYQRIEVLVGEIKTTVGKTTEDLNTLKTITGESFQSIKPEGIVNVVKESTEQDGTKTFARQSEVTQTVNSLKYEFSSMNNKIENNITVISEEGVTVKMYDDSSFDENGKVISGSTPVATTNINGQGMYIYKNDDGSPIAYFTMNGCYVANLKTDGMTGSDFVMSTENKGLPTTWYVAPNETGDGTGRNSSNKASTVNRVINEIKDRYGTYFDDEDITINVSYGEYNEEIAINGFLGSGNLNVVFDTSVVLYGQIHVENNTVDVSLDGQKTNSSTSGATIYSYQSKSQDAIVVKNSYCAINGFKAKNISSSGTTYYGAFARFTNGARGSVGNCDVIYYETPVVSSNASQVGFWNVKGKTTYRRTVEGGGIVVSGGTIPETTSSKDDINRGFIHQSGTLKETTTMGWYSSSGSGGSGGQDGSSSNTQTITKTFSLINLRSIPEGSGSATSGFKGKMAQGKYGSYKLHRGKADLPTSALSFIKSASSITSVSITCHRLNTSHGYAGAIPYPRLRFKNTSTGSYSSYYTDSSIKFARGDTKTIPINDSSIRTFLLNGGDELQFYVESGGNPTQQYSHYDNVKIKITIKK